MACGAECAGGGAQGKWVAVECEGRPDHRGHVISYDEQEDSHTVRWLDAAGAAEQWPGYISASAGKFLAARYIPAFYSSTRMYCPSKVELNGRDVFCL